MRVWHGVALFLLLIGSSRAGEVRVAAASDLRPAMEAMAVEFRERYPDVLLRISYGSSGKFATQIRHGAPFDVYFSADERYPQQLAAEGLGSEPRRYGRGRLVVWIRGEGAAPRLQDLLAPGIRRIAIANPEHAPYGQRAIEALSASGVLEALRPQLVLAENAGQSAHFIASGAVEAGVIARSLVLDDRLPGGRHALIDETLHNPLWQAAMLTRRGASNPDAERLLDFMLGERGRAHLAASGFALP